MVQYYPGAWRVVMCDFHTGFKEPEIVKYRPVITASKSRNDGAPLCTVIPISTTPPIVVRDHHYQIPDEALPNHLRNGEDHWVKVDMLTTVAHRRLTLLWHGRDHYGNRVYQTGKIPDEHIVAISSRIVGRLALQT